LEQLQSWRTAQHFESAEQTHAFQPVTQWGAGLPLAAAT
jgi:hypothetical protein